MTRAPMWKDGETPKKRRARRARKNAGSERKQKEKVRRRDKHCRFPLCGCQRPKAFDPLKFFPTVSHDKHKAMGGNPTGDRSVAELMILLCKWRHQDAPISIHSSHARNVYLTPEGNNGPIAWQLRATELFMRGIPYPMTVVLDEGFLEVARETLPGKLEPLEPWQRYILEQLAEMEL
jgi:hypothetical protein